MAVRKREWVTGKGESREAWIVDYADASGERHIKTFDRKKEADAYHATVRVDVSKGIHTPPSQSMTVAEAAQVWIGRVEADGRERTTIRQYKQHVDLHIVPRIGSTKLANLNAPKVEGFRDDLLEDLSRPMARKVLTSFKSLLKAARHGHLATGVSIKRDKRKERKLEVGRDIPEPREIKRLIEAATDARDRALLLTVALTGLRASEMRGLRWSDVDLKAADLQVRQRADRFNVMGPPKTESSARALPIPPELLSALKRWKLECPVNPGDLVFPTSKGHVEHHSNMLRGLAPILVRAGLVDGLGEPKYALHAFRHFFASWCINPRSRGGRQLPPKEVQTLLGHSSIVMTLDIYGHLFPRSDDSAELAAASRALFA
jgi:integrase